MGEKVPIARTGRAKILRTKSLLNSAVTWSLVLVLCGMLESTRVSQFCAKLGSHGIVELCRPY